LPEKAGVFGLCVDQGGLNPYVVRLPDVNSFQTNFPARGWKHLGLSRGIIIDYSFPNQLPREGMETKALPVAKTEKEILSKPTSPRGDGNLSGL